MKNTKKATKKTAAPARESSYTVIYPNGEVLVMHNSSRSFPRVLDRAKASGSITLWMIGDQTAALKYLSFRGGVSATNEVLPNRHSHPYSDLSKL